MPTQLFSASQLAGTTNTNILAGSKFEFLGVPSAIEVFAVVGPVAAKAGDLLMDLTFGSTVVGDNLAVPKEPDVDTGPDRNKHLIASGVGGAGDRVQVKIQNTNAADRDYRVLIVFRNLA